ncbi:MAG: hypothetical protein RR728_09790, partial [Oscillospiraceae bacterium]
MYNGSIDFYKHSLPRCRFVYVNILIFSTVPQAVCHRLRPLPLKSRHSLWLFDFPHSLWLFDFPHSLWLFAILSLFYGRTLLLAKLKGSFPCGIFKHHEKILWVAKAYLRRYRLYRHIGG